ncbi:MAG: Mov34/MPN/PAD-1 family protein [Candidatus Geothermarchaeales archaeon]
MTLRLKRRDAERIARHAEREYPEECCGIMVGTSGERKEVVRVLPLESRAEVSRRTRFSIDPQDIVEADRQAVEDSAEILGFYHSHPDVPPRPSVHDLEQAWPWYSYLIVGVSNGGQPEFASWVLREDRSMFDKEEVVLLDGEI